MIESVEDFRNRLMDIDTLVAYASANKKAIHKYQLFNKTAIILLCSHFEVFVEAFIAEHVDVMKICYRSDSLPQYMKDNYVNDTIKSLKDRPEPSRKQKPLKALFRLHNGQSLEMNSIMDLVLDMKYAFGKHGQEETEKLFKKFGFKSFVDSPGFQDNFKMINSAINIRNNIIHEGSAPTLSIDDLKKYKNVFLSFADSLEQFVLSCQVTLYDKIYYV